MSWTEQERHQARMRVLEELGPMLRALSHALELPEGSPARANAIGWKNELLALIEMIGPSRPN